MFFKQTLDSHALQPMTVMVELGAGGYSETKHRLLEQREMIKGTYALNCWRLGSS